MRGLLAFLFLLIFLLLYPSPAIAAELPPGYDLQEQLDVLGMDELAGRMPEESRELMSKSGLEDISVGSLLHLSPADFFVAVWQLFLDVIRYPVKMLGVFIGIMVLCALIGGVKSSTQGDELSQVFAIVVVLCMLASVATPMMDCISETVLAIHNASIFMLGYIPVFAAAVAAAGQPMSAAAYNMLLFSACQVVSQALSALLLPLMGIYLALAIVGSLSPSLGISSICAAVKRAVTWSLGFLLTIFVGILSVQTMVSGSADALSIKAGKFLISSFVPVVGGALSEAMLAAQGCLRLIKTSVGAFGLAAAVFMFMPTFLRVFGWYLVAGIAGIIADVLQIREISEMMKGCAAVLGVLISFLLCYVLLVIVSITVVMVAGGIA